MKNKKAWIRMVEVFIAIILIAGIVALVLSQRYLDKGDLSSEIYNKERLILKKIQLNNTIRQEIVSIDPQNLPVSSFNSGFPEKTLERINLELPSDLECYSKICSINDKCVEEEAQSEIKSDIYTQSVSIFTTLETYSPKQLKLFCWKK